jgi:hypothetical protein
VVAMSEPSEYVYAIGHPHGYVKIGRSTKPRERLDTIQTSSPYDLWLIGQFPVNDAADVEQRLHEHFADSHVRGEWYDVDYGGYDDLADLARMSDSNRDFDTIEEFRDWQQSVSKGAIEW